jgi:hypothetical protein
MGRNGNLYLDNILILAGILALLMGQFNKKGPIAKKKSGGKPFS